MRHLRQFENKSGSLKENAISDINELIDRLEYLRNFIVCVNTLETYC